MIRTLAVGFLAIVPAFAQGKAAPQVRQAGPVMVDPRTSRPKVHDKNWLKSQAVKRYGKIDILNKSVPKEPRDPKAPAHPTADR